MFHDAPGVGTRGSLERVNCSSIGRSKLTNGTIVKNILCRPDWFAITDLERKFYCQDAKFFDMLLDSKNELLHFVEVVSKPFVEENDVKILMVTKETRTHYNLKMES